MSQTHVTITAPVLYRTMEKDMDVNAGRDTGERIVKVSSTYF